jgi:hypothetical protein
MRTVQVLISFEVIGDATDAQIDGLLSDAVAQFDDPRDDEGERVDFGTRIVGAEWEEAE